LDNGLTSGVAHRRVGGEAEIIIGGEVEEGLTIEMDAWRLRGLNAA
jgi:hypothetical protein